MRQKIFFGLTCLFWTLFIVVLAAAVLSSMTQLHFTADSWSYWELSKTVFDGDFYRVKGWRQFQTTLPFSISFPPLWPVVIALADKLFHRDFAVMVLLNGIMTLLIASFIELAFRLKYQWKHIGLFAGYGLLGFSGYMEEVVAGRSMPLTLLLLSLLVPLWIRPLSRRKAVLIGCVVGLMSLTRFDTLPFATVVTGLLFFRAWREPFKAALYLSALILTVSPYLVYNLSHFNALWFTDNAWVALSSIDAYATDFYVRPPLTIFDQPTMGIEKIIRNASKIIFSRQMPVTVMPLLFSFVIVRQLGRRPNISDVTSNRPQTSPEEIRRAYKGIAILLGAYASTLFGCILAGYGDARYFSPHFFLILVLFAISLNTLNREIIYFISLAGLVLFIYFKYRSFNHAFQENNGLPPRAVNEEMLQKKYAPIKHCYETIGLNKSLLVLDNDPFALELAAVMGLETLLRPGNFDQLTREETKEFFKRFRVGAVLLTADANSSITGIPGLDAFHYTECGAVKNFYILKSEAP